LPIDPTNRNALDNINRQDFFASKQLFKRAALTPASTGKRGAAGPVAARLRPAPLLYAARSYWPAPKEVQRTDKTAPQLTLPAAAKKLKYNKKIPQ
jgi:hypothetical protein